MLIGADELTAIETGETINAIATQAGGWFNREKVEYIGGKIVAATRECRSMSLLLYLYVWFDQFLV